ncbi:MAG: HAD family hydrolase [Bacteroidales bacterium]|nr:HAD family hydrolase [Bacteroidales bacterium]
MNRIKVIAFDADDTLWVNEPYYREAEKIFCSLFDNCLPEIDISAELYNTEMSNLEKYGYGIKGFVLSMIETALRVCDKTISAEIIEKIINIGKELLELPIELLDNIDLVLSALKNNYILIVATKGDLLDQSRKLSNSGLEHYFHHIEVMHDKTEEEYQKLIKRLNIKNEEFLMVGNSLKSDILPVISIGGQAIHIPYHTTWEHETANSKGFANQYQEIENVTELLNILNLRAILG